MEERAPRPTLDAKYRMAPLQISTRQLIAAAIVGAVGLMVASTPSLQMPSSWTPRGFTAVPHISGGQHAFWAPGTHLSVA